MGLYDSDSSNCKRHPNEKQQPGVCPSCLREKLSMLSNTPFREHRRSVVVSHSSSISSTPPYSSSASSSSASATRNRHRRNGSDACVVSVGTVLIDGLKKSRSVSCAPLSRSRGGGGGGSTNNNRSNNSNNRIGKIYDGDSNNNNSNYGKSGVEEKDGSRRKKGGFLKRLIKKT